MLQSRSRSRSRSPARQASLLLQHAQVLLDNSAKARRSARRFEAAAEGANAEAMRTMVAADILIQDARVLLAPFKAAAAAADGRIRAASMLILNADVAVHTPP